MSSTHTAITQWKRTTPEFTYETYSRDHMVLLQSQQSLEVSAAKDFAGNEKLTNPEELLVAALSSCHMLTFLAVCAKKKIVVEDYRDEAVGTLEKPEGQPMQVTKCVLHPKVVFASEISREDLEKLHHQAHRGCFIANSVKTEVTFEIAD